MAKISETSYNRTKEVKRKIRYLHMYSALKSSSPLSKPEEIHEGGEV